MGLTLSLQDQMRLRYVLAPTAVVTHPQTHPAARRLLRPLAGRNSRRLFPVNQPQPWVAGPVGEAQASGLATAPCVQLRPPPQKLLPLHRRWPAQQALQLPRLPQLRV